MPVTTSTPPTIAASPSIAWLTMSRARLGTRSMTAPVHGARTSIGMNCSPVTMPSAVPEFWVRTVRTTQSWAARPIQVPTLEMIAPVA